MSYDTMASHDDGIEEAKKIVMRYLKRETCGEEGCETCRVLRNRRRLLLAALERAKENR